MSGEMTPGSNYSLPISRKGIERNHCLLKKQKPRSEGTSHFSGSKTKPPCLRTCLAVCLKDQVEMDLREVDDGTEGRRFRELASKWFIETQVPFIVHNGLFPSWFLGFITRKDAEEILRERELGCFLIRLSEKTIGYVLSYKGRDRCRHFVINQSDSGQFVVCGDTEGHDTVSDLIEHYKTSPVQPFGEYLTSTCFETLKEDVYDRIEMNKKKQSSTTFRELKNVKNQQKSIEQPPTRPPKSVHTPEEVPPLPLRNRNLEAPLNIKDKVFYAQLRKQSPRERPRSQHISQDYTTRDKDISRSSSPSGPGSVYSQPNLLDSKSRSLPLLDNRSDGDQSYRLSAPPHTPPRLSPKPIRPAASCSPQLEWADVRGRFSSSHGLEVMDSGAVYHLAGNPGSQYNAASNRRSLMSEQRDSVYTEVPAEAPVCQVPQGNTYEMIPVSEDTSQPNPNNTYEPLQDIRPKQNHSSWGLKNNKWRWLFPEVRRK